MGKYTEKDLRRAKASALQAVTDQQRRLGVPDPGGRVVEEFVDPIIAKMDREGPGEPRVTAAPERQRPDDVFVEQIGVYDWNLRTDEVVVHEGSYQPGHVDLMHAVFQKLMRHPSWRDKVVAAREQCKRHLIGGQLPGCASCARRERHLRDIWEAARKVFTPKPRKLVVS